MVFITGEVAKSGPVQIHGPLNIVQALAMAGGFNEWANKKDIRILRQGPAGLQTLHFNYQDAIDGETRPIYLKAGDTVDRPVGTKGRGLEKHDDATHDESRRRGAGRAGGKRGARAGAGLARPGGRSLRASASRRPTTTT